MTGLIRFNDDLYAEIMLDVENERIVVKVNGETVYDSNEGE